MSETGKPAFKGFEELQRSGVSLDDEVLITHTSGRDGDPRLILAELGCGEEVLMVEGILLLEVHFNTFLESFQGMREYEEDLRLLNRLVGAGSVDRLRRGMGLVQQLTQGKVRGDALSRDEHTLLSSLADPEVRFSKLARALMLAGSCSGEDDELEVQLLAAAMETGVTVFKLILESVQEDFPQNQALEYLKENPRVAISSWAELYKRRTERNASSHPFAMIGSSGVRKALKAATVMEGLSLQYPELQMLIEASLPFIRQKIRQHLASQKEEFDVDSVFNKLRV